MKSKLYESIPTRKYAIKWTGNKKDLQQIVDWIGDSFAGTKGFGHSFYSICIHTLEGNHWASPGDYVIQGIKGEFYPCKPDIFEKSYKEVK